MSNEINRTFWYLYSCSCVIFLASKDRHFHKCCSVDQLKTFSRRWVVIKKKKARPPFITSPLWQGLSLEIHLAFYNRKWHWHGEKSNEYWRVEYKIIRDSHRTIDLFPSLLSPVSMSDWRLIPFRSSMDASAKR